VIAKTTTKRGAPSKAATPVNRVFEINTCQQGSSDQPRQDSEGIKNDILICVVDPDHSLHKEVSRILASAYPIEFFRSVQAFLNRKVHQGPCCIVLEGHMPGLSGNRLQEILSTDQRSEQVIFVSGNSDIPTCAQAFKAGAVDFLTKPLKNAELLRAVESGIQRSEQLFRVNRVRVAAQALLDQLTPREREVLGFVIAGHLNKVTAAELGITEKMVKKHRGHFMRKLKIGSVAELVWFCLRLELKPNFFDGGLRSPIQVLGEFLHFTS
jgi:FixJ family two-component response regulator